MAKAQGPVLLRGKIDNFIFRVREGKNIVHKAPDEIKVRNATALYYGNRMEFGGAAKMAAQIYQGLQNPSYDKPDDLGPIFRGYTQNYLTGRIRKAPLKNKVHVVGETLPYLEEFRFHHVAKGLLGCDLSKETAPSKLVHMTPIGPLHNPTAIKITGLEAAARAVPVLGNARLEFRIHLRQSEIRDVVYCPHRKQWDPSERLSPDRRTDYSEGHTANWCPPSDWIPAEIIPKEGITLPIPELTLDPKLIALNPNYFTAIMIEWLEIRTVGRRTIKHHDHGIVKIAALHAPSSAWETRTRGSNADSNSGSGTISSVAKHHLTPKPANLKPKINWKTDPKAYLQSALARIAPILGPPKPAT